MSQIMVPKTVNKEVLQGHIATYASFGYFGGQGYSGISVAVDVGYVANKNNFKVGAAANS